MTKSPAKTGKKQGSSKFHSGQSGNPAGRPQGSRNKASLAVEELLEGEVESLTRKAVEMALGGNARALKLCLERICPPRRDRGVAIELPKLENGEGLPTVMASIIAAVSSGDLTPTEGQALSHMTEAYRKAVETADLEARITALEKARDTA